MKVRITSCTSRSWYEDKIGEVFDVDPVIETTLGLGQDLYRRGDGYGIFVRDCVPVVELKLVTHEGVQYEVPSWATRLTRNCLPAHGYKSTAVIAWEVEPTWSDTAGYSNLTCQWVTVQPYVAPKPEGHFNVAI